MKRLALVATLAVAAACSKGDKMETADTTMPAMAPAPAPMAMDSAAMRMDSTRRADSMKMAMDSTKSKTKR